MSVEPVQPSSVRRDASVLQTQYQVSGDEIEELRQWIASLGLPAALVKTLLLCTDPERVVDGWCPGCNATVKVRYPNYSGVVNVVKFLSEYKLGKPVERRVVNVTQRVVHELESLSDAELAELAGAEDAEWKQLPPAA